MRGGIPALLAVLLFGSGLAGCITSSDRDEYFAEAGFEPLRIGAKLEIRITTDVGNDLFEWEFHGVEDSLNQYGLLEAAAVFRTSDMERSYSLATRAFTSARTLDYLSMAGPQSGCNAPLPLDVIVLLAGAQIPTRIERQSFHGAVFALDIHQEDESLHLLLSAAAFSLAAEVAHVPDSLENEFTVKTRLIPGAICPHAEERTGTIIFQNGRGDEVPMLHGYSPAPFTKEAHIWPPAGDLPGAALPLQRAVARLELDPRYQLLKSDAPYTPKRMGYGGTLGTWGWFFLLDSVDGRDLSASVTLPVEVENAPVEAVVHVWEDSSAPSVMDGSIVDLRRMQQSVEVFSGGRAGKVTDFELRTHTPDSSAAYWTAASALLRLADPDDPELRFQCSFLASTGAISDCYHGHPVGHLGGFTADSVLNPAVALEINTCGTGLLDGSGRCLAKP